MSREAVDFNAPDPAEQMLDVKVEGRHYQIPDIWLAGFMTSHPKVSILDAVQYWINQESLGEQWIKEREAHGERHA